MPLTSVALSEVPAAVAAQRLAPLANLPAADRAAETRRVLRDRNRLRTRIAALIRSRSPATCSGTGAIPSPGIALPQPGPFQPNARRSS